MVYTYTNIKDLVNGAMHGKVDNLKSALNTINQGVRQALGKVDLRSTKRKSTLSPNLFNEVYDYSCPSDLKGMGIIDVVPQINRSRDYDIDLVSPEEFDRRKSSDFNLITLYDYDGTRRLRLSMDVDDDSLVVSELDSLTSGGGTWTLFGDGTNVRADSDNYVKGNGSIAWDISSAGGTTAGIYNSSLDTFDLTDYVSGGSVFVWVYITSVTNLTNFILRIGTDSSNYFTKTITTNNEGVSFYNGWNLLRFDFSTSTEVGTVTDDTCNYVAIYMTKDGAKVSETDYRFDWLVVKRGEIHNLIYYSKYGWQSSAGTYLENSTATTDYINADTEEVNIIIGQIAELGFRELRDYDDWKIQKQENKEDIQNYQMKYPSEAKVYTTEYYQM